MPSIVKRGLGILAATSAATLVAGLAVVLLSPSEPFDLWYDPVDPEEADWELVVNYSVAGLMNEKQYVIHYRRRAESRSSEESWSFGKEPAGSPLSGRTDVYVSSLAFEGAGVGETESIRPIATPQGVKMAIDIDRTRGDKPFQTRATFGVPFGQQVTGRSDNLDYRAAWRRLPRAR